MLLVEKNDLVGLKKNVEEGKDVQGNFFWREILECPLIEKIFDPVSNAFRSE